MIKSPAAELDASTQSPASSRGIHLHGLREALVFCLLVLFFAVLYGFIPYFQVNSLGLWYPVWGSALSLSHQRFPDWFTLHDVLIPHGSPVLGGFLVNWAIAVLIAIFSLREDVAGNIIGLLAVAAALYSFTRLMLLVEVRKWIAYFTACLWLAMPFIIMHMEYGPMGFGFMLFPVSVLADLWILRRIESGDYGRNKFLIWLIVRLILVRWLITGIDWYIAVIAMVGGGVPVLYGLIRKLVLDRRLSQIARPALVWGLTWIIGVLPWYLAMPKGKITEPFSMDMFRAQGADVISCLVPRGQTLSTELLGIRYDWPPFEFYGDGTNVDANFLGYSLLVTAFITCALLLRKRARSPYILPLLVAGTSCFILSLGPSLKFDSRRTSAKSDLSDISYEDYQMPAAKAVLSLPTEPAFRVFPLSMMRAVYRWMIFSKVVLLIAFGWCVNYLLRQGWRFAAVLILAASFVEFFPDYPVKIRDTRGNYEQYRSMGQGLIDTLRKELHPGERVLFLSSMLENDYLASWITPKLGVNSFNGGGDKPNWIATPYMPEAIRRLKRYDLCTNDEVKDLLLLTLRSGLVQKVVVPYFSLRWDSYDWPPDEDDLVANREKFAYIKTLATDSVDISTYRYFSVLSLPEGIARLAGRNGDQIDSIASYIGGLPSDALFLVDGANSPMTALMSGRGENFIDYRVDADVLKAFRDHRHVYFVLTGFQKAVHEQLYDSLKTLFHGHRAFSTAEYGVYSITPSVYRKFRPYSVVTADDCIALKDEFNSSEDTASVAGWSSDIDFGKDDFQRQLCEGWYGYEKSSTGSFRWMGARASLLLRVPSALPKNLAITVYPLVDHVKGGEQQVTIRLNGYLLGEKTLTQMSPTTITIPLAEGPTLGPNVAMVTLEVVPSILPTATDNRELGVVVNRVLFK